MGADTAGVVVGREVTRRQAGKPEELPCGRGRAAGEELALRIEPSLIESLYEDTARRDRCHEKMLVELHRLLVVDVLAVSLAVPMMEHAHLGGDVLTEVALGERHAAATGLVGNAHGEAFIADSGQKGGLCQTRTAGGHGLLRIDLWNTFGKVKPARKRPGPRA